MMYTTDMKYTYLSLSIIGIIVPFTQFVPWSLMYGFDMNLLVSSMFANYIASGISLDALIAAVAIILFILYDRTQTRTSYWWIAIVGIFLSGISFALPFYLYLRERALGK